jgi:hypothetical protein
MVIVSNLIQSAYASNNSINFNKSFTNSQMGLYVFPDNSSMPIANASKEAIDKAGAYISNRLGENYYNTYVSNGFNEHYINLSGRYYPTLNQTYVYFTYDVPFSNGTTISQTEGYNPLFIAVVLNGNYTVIYYAGPAKPYVINVSANDAKSITGYLYTALVAGTFDQYDQFSGYSVAWAVSRGGNSSYPGMYVDAQTGNILGQYFGFTSPGGSMPGSPLTMVYKFGNYSILPTNDISILSKNKVNLLWYYIAIITAVIVLILYVNIKSKKNHK